MPESNRSPQGEIKFICSAFKRRDLVKVQALAALSDSGRLEELDPEVAAALTALVSSNRDLVDRAYEYTAIRR